MSNINFKFIPAEYLGGQLVDGKPGNSFEDTFDSVFECIQNCIDARKNDDTKAILKIHFKKAYKSDLPFLDSRFTKHVNTSIRCKDKFCLQEDIVNLLIMEDFNTTGITGNPNNMKDQTETGAPNNYFNMNFNFGGNPKLGDHKLGGSEGEGRQSFCLSSKISTFFYYSIDSTNKNRGSFFGISYLAGRMVEDTKFLSYAYFGKEISEDGKTQCIPLTENDQLISLAAKFKLKRRADESGTSIIIPYFLEILNNKKLLISKIIDIYRVAILRDKLEVHVEEEKIDKDSILALNQNSIEEDGKELSVTQKDLCNEYYKFLQEINKKNIEHGHEINFSNSTKLEKENISNYEKLLSSYHSNELIKIRLNFIVNRINEAASDRNNRFKEYSTYLDIYIKKYPEWANILDKLNDFIRGPMSIHKLRKKTMQMFWLIDIQDEHASLMIKNAEKANHSNISGENDKLQRNYKGAQNLVNLLKNISQKIYNLITNDENTTDRDITKDLFSVPDTTYGIRNTKNSLEDNDDDDEEENNLALENKNNTKNQKEVDPVVPPIFEKLKYYLQESKEEGSKITYYLKGIKYDKNKIKEKLKLAEDYIDSTQKITRGSFNKETLKKMDKNVAVFKRRILEYKDYISSGYTFYPRRIEIDAAYDGEGVSNPFKKYSTLDFDFGDDQQFLFNLNGNVRLVQKNENKIRLLAKNEDFAFAVTGFQKDSFEDVRWRDRSINLDEPDNK